jgi:hypothetical protein
MEVSNVQKRTLRIFPLYFTIPRGKRLGVFKMSIIDEYLKRREENRRLRPPNIYYLYDLTSPCMRDTVLGIFLDKPHTIETLRKFEAGNRLQDWWRDILKATGHDIIAEEQRARYKTKRYSIHGRYDLITQFDYGPFILREIKTMKTAYWLKEEKEEHAQQDQFYLNRTGIEFGSIDYIDKLAFATGDRQIDYCFPTKKDPAIFCDLITTADSLHPHAEIVQDLLARGIRELYCDHYDECQKLTKMEPKDINTKGDNKS